MSLPPSPPVTFAIQVGVVGLPPCPASLRRPPQVSIDFPACWYELSGPYVGSAEIDTAHPSNPSDAGTPIVKPLFGYRVPPKGQLQIILKNQMGTALKLFLVPYDLCDMPFGSKTVLRVRYVTAANDPTSPSKASVKELTRYAVQVSFVTSPAMASSTQPVEPASADEGLFAMDLDSSPTPSPAPKPPKRQKPRVYLSGSIRLVFPSRSPDKDETLRCVRDEPGQGPAKYSPWTPQKKGGDSEHHSPHGSPVFEARRSHNKRRSLLGESSFSLDD
ncbi:hypothetical protein FRB99_005945 [Tulasnella sp. 403]|nr:hypothetical protein FRB99_005945 [Tulasnella sp. 403]